FRNRSLLPHNGMDSFAPNAQPGTFDFPLSDDALRKRSGEAKSDEQDSAWRLKVRQISPIGWPISEVAHETANLSGNSTKKATLSRKRDFLMLASFQPFAN
nr:hypothetical protein [Acidobacteriota bacterium]